MKPQVFADLLSEVESPDAQSCILDEMQDTFEDWLNDIEELNNETFSDFIDIFLDPELAQPVFEKLIEAAYLKYGDSKASVPETKTNTYLTVSDKPLYIVLTTDVKEGITIEYFEDKRAYKKYYSQLKPNSKSWNE